LCDIGFKTLINLLDKIYNHMKRSYLGLSITKYVITLYHSKNVQKHFLWLGYNYMPAMFHGIKPMQFIFLHFRRNHTFINITIIMTNQHMNVYLGIL